MAQKTIWITGGGTGIGRELATLYAKDGHRVAISGRTAETLAETAEADPSRIHAVPADVTDPAAIDRAIASIEAELGPIDLAILNAGTYSPLWVGDFNRDAFRKQIETNLLGVANALDPLLERMRARRAGTIVLVSSVAGYSGLPGATAYGASKAALINLAEALYSDARRHGIRIALVNPGFVRTPLTAQNDFPMPFLIDADRAARIIHDGIAAGAFEIAFPRRFALLLKLARRLPYSLYFALTRRMLRE
jgi:NAD(P)-dependent dehydrogenase (short-subunit alcohol dehydrogenase family)